MKPTSYARCDGTMSLGDASQHDVVNVPEEKVLIKVAIYEDGRTYAFLNSPAPESTTHVITIKQTGDKVTAEVEEV